jgi:ribose transport system substrate-binding protein
MLVSIGLSLALLLSVVLAGPAKKPFTIAFIPGITTDAFYISMKVGADQATAELGDKLIWQGASQWGPELQTPIVNTIIATKPDFVITAPTDKQAMIAPLKKAFDAGIPIITVDTFIGTGVYGGSGPGDFPLSYIGSDNEEGGRIAADALAKAIGAKGTVAILNVKPGISTTDQRQQGFERQVAAKYPNMKIVSLQFHNDDASRAASLTQSIIVANTDLAGIFATNVVGGQGVARGIEAAKKSGKVKLIVFDAEQSGVESLRKGLIDLLIAQKPLEMGYLGVMFAHAYLAGYTDLPKRVATGYAVISRGNVDDPNVARFIYKK